MMWTFYFINNIQGYLKFMYVASVLKSCNSLYYIGFQFNEELTMK